MPTFTGTGDKTITVEEQVQAAEVVFIGTSEDDPSTPYQSTRCLDYPSMDVTGDGIADASYDGVLCEGDRSDPIPIDPGKFETGSTDVRVKAETGVTNEWELDVNYMSGEAFSSFLTVPDSAERDENVSAEVEIANSTDASITFDIVIDTATQQKTQQLEVSGGDARTTTQSITVENEEEQQVNLSVSPTGSDAEDLVSKTITVSSTVEDSGSKYSLSIDTPDSVRRGESYDATARVINRTASDQRVTLDFAGTQEIRLFPGSSRAITKGFEAGQGSSDTITATLKEGGVNIKEKQANVSLTSANVDFDLSVDVPDEIPVGTEYDVVVEVTNTGDNNIDASLNMTSIGENTRDSFGSISPSSTKTRNYTFLASETDEDIGEVNVTVEASAFGELTSKDQQVLVDLVKPEVELDVEIPDQVCLGAGAKISGKVRNAGGLKGEFRDALANQSPRDSITLAPSESYNFEYEIDPEQTGELATGVTGQALLGGSVVHEDDETGSVEVISSDIRVNRVVVPEGSQVDEGIEIGYSLTNDKCPSTVVMDIVDSDTGNSLKSIDKKYDADTTEDLKTTISMPPKVLNIDVTIAKMVNGEVVGVTQDSFTIEPRRAMIIDTASSIQIWGKDSGSFTVDGTVRASGVSTDNLESSDSVKSAGSLARICIEAASEDVDTINFSSIDNLGIRMSEPVTVITDGTNEGEQDTYGLETGAIGTFGLLRPTVSERYRGMTQEEVESRLGYSITD